MWQRRSTAFLEAPTWEDSMLVLSREPGQKIYIDRMRRRPGLRNLWNLFGGAPERVATILLKDIQQGQASIGIIADPRRYRIDREEVAIRVAREGPRRNGPGSTGRKPRRSAAILVQSMFRLINPHIRRNILRFQSESSP